MIFIGFPEVFVGFRSERSPTGSERTRTNSERIPTDSNGFQRFRGSRGGDQGRGLWAFAILTAWRPHEGVGGFAMVSCDPLPSSTSEHTVFSLSSCTARAIQGIQSPAPSPSSRCFLNSSAKRQHGHAPLWIRAIQSPAPRPGCRGLVTAE